MYVSIIMYAHSTILTTVLTLTANVCGDTDNGKNLLAKL